MQLEEEQQTKAVQPISNIPPLPVWPTSKPGPEATPVPAGGKPVRTRTDQMVEVAYNMETGVSTVRATGESTPDNNLPAAELPKAPDEKSRTAEKHKKAKR